MNVIMIAGNVGSDPEMRQSNNGKPVLNFKVAVTSGWGEKAQTLWIDCSMWGPRGEKLHPYLEKGKAVTVYGTFGLRTYTTQKGPGAAITCDVADVKLQGGRQEKSDGPRAKSEPFDDKKAADHAFDDDLPF